MKSFLHNNTTIAILAAALVACGGGSGGNDGNDQQVQAPQLALVKEVINNNGGTAVPGDWTLSASGYNPAAPTPGTYALSESGGPAGYTRTSLTCSNSGDAQVTSVTLAAGENVTCTFVNDDDAPSLALVKQVINDDGGTAVPGDWTLSASGYNPAAPTPGTYALSESGGPAGYTRTSLTCSNSGDAQVTSVTLAAGENVTCTFVNDDSSSTGTNINFDNPTLTVYDNNEVSPGDALDLVWSDEFDAVQLDPNVWFFEKGDGSQYGIPGWGNSELQYYLEDSALLKNGLLVITAREETVGGRQYTSARINTRDRFAFRYGRIEARIRLPGGQGLWPAFWLLPQDSVYGTWAASGEIDIVEAVNLGASGGNTVYGTIHYGGTFPANVSSGEQYLVATNVTTDFHVFALEWDETELRWYVDDVLFAVRNNWSTTGAPFPAPFDQPFYILFNVAVGGNFPGAPNADTVFPVTMEVDWVRVYSGAP